MITVTQKEQIVPFINLFQSDGFNVYCDHSQSDNTSSSQFFTGRSVAAASGLMRGVSA